MEFDGTFTIEDVSMEEVWLALSDPVLIKQCLPGCQFMTRVEDPDDVDFEARRESEPDDDPATLPEADLEDISERAFEEGAHYAALLQLSVGSVKPSFQTVVTIDEREFPVMNASGEGSASDSSFEMASGMTLVETDEGVDIEWHAEADVFGTIAQMGQRVISPVANRVVNRFFSNVEDRLTEVADENDGGGIRDRIQDLL
ncbi:CoxG family protein [Halostagnicola kamekurae]|uniref:Carbon monoxide dehydrogenase subunit G n=1 Tax=Halostagnicola kamekurae TaxID=619731 RepID=A0A1I6TFJ6_9EURY|nr:SRPBCC domain-containing protein [Halostagnicola kamekurae]SFS87961.1 Carbon monoxide dehydrogenase subunit G [Halostagnicola kamekurae]